jgi:hypothetical protein
MFVWGSGHKTIQKDVNDSSVCTGCSHANEFSVVVDYDYSHIYWIFKSVKNVKTYLVCGNCGHAQDSSNQTESDLFAKLGGNPIPFMDRFGGVVFVLLIVGFGAYAFLSQASRDSTGAIDSAGQIDAFDIRLGDCFNDDSSVGTDRVSEVYSLDAVPCAEPHDNEVFAVFDLTLEAFPEGEAMTDIVGEECLQRFEPYVGRDYEASSLEITTMYPTYQSWNERGDREVGCILFDMDLSKLQGSMKGSGM